MASKAVWSWALLAGAALFAMIASDGAKARTGAPQAVGSQAIRSSPAQASTTVEGLTVIAPKAEQEKLPVLVNRFVEAHSAASRIGQLSRWAAPLCPQTGGLTAPFDAYVSARVKAVAASVGAPVDRHPNRNFPCKPNLLIVFTTTPQTLMDNVRKRHP